MRARKFGVESICRVLTEQGVQIAPRTYRNWKTATPSPRTVTDAQLTDALRATIGTPEGMYGRRKMTAHLRRQGYQVAACTVDRLMRDEGLSGVIRGRKHRTTIPGGKDSRRAPDLLNRDFTAEAPNRKWVTDFTYTRTWLGFVYVAFVVDCFSRTIVGWHAASVKDTTMVTTALKMALWRRDHADRRVGDGLIHHSDAGSQGGFNRLSQHLVIWEVFDDSSAASSGSRYSSCDEVSGGSAASARDGAAVLDRDRQGVVAGGGRHRRRRVAAGRTAVVPQRWRHAAVRSQATVGALPVFP
jgi:hypothetical protein